MSFYLCCTSPSEKAGFRRDSLQDEEEEESRRRSINVSELREEYRSSRERQRRNIQVLIYRTVSVELKDAVSIFPINHSLTSPCELYDRSPPALTFEEDPTSCDPWMVPLGLHQHSCPRCLKTVSSQHLADPPRSSSSDVDHISTSKIDLTQSPVPNSSEQKPCNGSNDETSITSPPRSTSSLHSDLKESWSPGRHTCNSILKSSSSLWRGSAPSFRFTRQLSVGGLGQNQNFPFPCRKTRRIPEAVRRLGMYSSI